MNGLKCPETPRTSESSQIELTSIQVKSKLIKACILKVGGSKFTFFHKGTGIWLVESLFEREKIDQNTKEFYLELVEKELPEDDGMNPLGMIVEDILESSENSLVM